MITRVVSFIGLCPALMFRAAAIWLLWAMTFAQSDPVSSLVYLHESISWVLPE